MPGGRPPPGRGKIANAPLPGLTTSANAPWLSWGIGIAGIDWPVLIAVQKNYFRSRRVQKICWISIFFQAQSFIKLHWLNGLTYREICRAQYENAILVRPCGPSIVNRTQSNLIHGLISIEFGNLTKSNSHKNNCTIEVNPGTFDLWTLVKRRLALKSNNQFFEARVTLV